ncbi:tail sheath stabilizer and completion protein [bacterium]|nr:tail sheath stabilizer and completion protein [bacterium]
MIHSLDSFAKTIDIFGYLFSNIHIRRWIEDNGTKYKKDIKVPIEFTGKERMFYLLNNKMKEENIKLDSVFPRMSYTMKDIAYDASRMTNRNWIISVPYGESGAEVELNRVPYNVKFDLDIAATHKSDLFKILEQILPWFRPSLILKANLNPFIGDDKVDVPVVLDSTNFEDFNQEAPFSETPDKLITFGLSFTMKTWLYKLNDEDNDGNYPDIDTGLGKVIKEIELGVTGWNDKREVTDDSLYYIHYPEHI